MRKRASAVLLASAIVALLPACKSKESAGDAGTEAAPAESAPAPDHPQGGEHPKGAEHPK